MQRECVIYVRFSPRPGEEHSLSNETQEVQCRAYAKASGWNVTHVFADAAVSGASTEGRDGLQAMLNHLAATRGRKQVVLSYSLSRLARNTRDILVLSEFLEKLGSDLACVSEKIDTSNPMGRFIFTLLGALNQLEREQIAQRTSDSMSTMIARGLSPGKIPHGYKIISQEPGQNGRKRTRVAVDEDALPAYRMIHDLRQARWTFAQISAYLNDAGMTPRGLWTRDRIRRALEAIERYGLLDEPTSE